MSKKLFRLVTAPTQRDGCHIYRTHRGNLPAFQGLSLQSLHLEPGAIREPHVHRNAAQLDLMVAGSARDGIVGLGGERQLLEVHPGEMSFVPQGYVHWIENPGPGHFNSS